MIEEKQDELERETRKRVKRMKNEFKRLPELKVFENTEGYDQMIAQIGIPISALCEHHQVAFQGHVSIAYIPDRWLIGLSKLGRVAEFYLNPTIKTIQEKATHKIMKHLEESLKPKGLMVIVEAQHNCIAYRGVKKPSLTITSSISGVFAKDPSAKSEFLSLVNK